MLIHQPKNFKAFLAGMFSWLFIFTLLNYHHIMKTPDFQGGFVWSQFFFLTNRLTKPPKHFFREGGKRMSLRPKVLADFRLWNFQHYFSDVVEVNVLKFTHLDVWVVSNINWVGFFYCIGKNRGWWIEIQLKK